MNNEVTFSIKILVNGQEQMVRATANSKELGAAINQVSAESSTLNTRLLNLNDRVMAFQNLLNGMRQVVDVAKEMTDMYARQEMAEVKAVSWTL